MDNFSPEQAEQALQQAKMQIAQQQTQLLVSTITGKCFDKCVSSPSSSLSKREETCLAMCYDKFIQVQQVVIKSMSWKKNQNIEKICKILFALIIKIHCV